MIHPATTLGLVSRDIGQGVFASRPIPRGTIVWTLCQLDQVISPDKAREFPPAYQSIIELYSFRDLEGNFVLCWDNGRYVNHSCEPNMLSMSMEIDIAVRDIEVGEQITCEYGSMNASEALDCNCGSESCRGRIEVDDMLRLGSQWDEQVLAASREILKVDQPLWIFLRDPDSASAVAKGEQKPTPQADFHFNK